MDQDLLHILSSADQWNCSYLRLGLVGGISNLCSSWKVPGIAIKVIANCWIEVSLDVLHSGSLEFVTIVHHSHTGVDSWKKSYFTPVIKREKKLCKASSSHSQSCTVIDGIFRSILRVCSFVRNWADWMAGLFLSWFAMAGPDLGQSTTCLVILVNCRGLRLVRRLPHRSGCVAVSSWSRPAPTWATSSESRRPTRSRAAPPRLSTTTTPV